MRIDKNSIDFCSFFKISSKRNGQRQTPEEMEKPQNFSQSPQAFDAVFFSGSKNGLTLIVATERRPKNVTYGIVYLMVEIINQIKSFLYNLLVCDLQHAI